MNIVQSYQQAIDYTNTVSRRAARKHRQFMVSQTLRFTIPNQICLWFYEPTLIKQPFAHLRPFNEFVGFISYANSSRIDCFLSAALHTMAYLSPHPISRSPFQMVILSNKGGT